MTKRNPVYRTVLHYFFLLMIAVLFAACFHFRISPVLTNEVEFDASCFHVIGKSMLSGQMPYLNFIDNKGPVQYFIYMVASLLFDFPWGIFILSALLDFCMLILLETICKRLEISHSFWILPLFLFFYASVCSNGGLTEDFALPLTMAAFLVYLNFNDLLKNHRMRVSAGFLMGLLFWLCAFTRINNALPIGLITAAIGVQLLLKKEYRKTLVYIGSFAAGTVVVVLPIVLWLLINGAFSEFLNQFLINNFKYSAAEDAIPKAELFFYNRFGYGLFFLVFEGVLGAFLFYRHGGKARLSILITTLVVLIGTGLSFLAMTKAFPHYLLVILIPAFFGFILAFAYPNDAPEKKRGRKIVVTAATVLCCIGMVFAFSGKLKLNIGLSYAKAAAGAIADGSLFQKTDYELTIDRLAEQIPNDERDSVFSIEADPQFYAFSGITPCKRMFVCQSLFTGISDDYYDEFLSYFSVDPPMWLITEKPLGTSDICGLGNTLMETYRLVDGTAGIYYLYARSEANEIN